MKAVLDCFPCYLKQAISAARACTSEPAQQEAAVKAVARVFPELSLEVTPAENSWRVLKAVSEALGCADPFWERKRESNRLALGLLPRLQKMLDQADDRLLTAIKLAAAGNVIDMGILPNFDIEKAIEQALKEDLAINHYPQLGKDLLQAEKILYLGDNSGEIVFDMLLAKELSRYAQVTFVVKGAPILNDATREDAVQVGLEKVVEVIDNGNDGVGTILSWASPRFLAAFRGADLILSKGQANFETLDGEKAPIYFLFRVKCECLAAYLGVPLGKAVLLRQFS